jgi:WD40 repeat protein
VFSPRRTAAVEEGEMPWPLSQDYNEAVQDPGTAFGDAELQTGQLQLNRLGLPLPRSGNFADVYEVSCPATQSKWAVKCFTRQVPGLRERYTVISKYLQEANLPFTVDFQFLQRGIRIRGDWFPVLKMRWVEGFLLNEFVRDNLDKPVLLQALAQIWLRMSKRLREAKVAHADLQHGNVLLVPGSKQTALAVKLIDYDGMWVPALAQKKSGEVGHPNYQHPQRVREGIYDAEVDRFPLVVVSTALRAVSIGGRGLWDRYDNGDNLLFREADLKAPDDSPLFRELGAASDPLLRKLIARLRQACRERLQDTPLLEELVPEEKPTAIQPKPAAPTAAAAAVPPPVWGFESSPQVRTARQGNGALRKRRARGGLPGWAKWAAAIGLVALLTVTGLVVVLLMQEKPDTRPGPLVHNLLPTSRTGVVPPPVSIPVPPPSSAPPETGPAPPQTRTVPPATDLVPPVTDPVPPETRSVPPETQRVPPETRRVPPETQPTPPQTRTAPPDTGKPSPPPKLAVAGSLFRMVGPSNDLVAVSMEKDSSWQLYRPARHRILRRFGADQPSAVVAFDATPDGKLAITADEKQDVILWDTRTGKPVWTMHYAGRPPTVVAVSADGRIVAHSEGFGVVQLWDIEKGQAIKPIPVRGKISSLALSPDGRFVACGVPGNALEEPGALPYFETTTGKTRHVWLANGAVAAMAFSLDGRRFLNCRHSRPASISMRIDDQDASVRSLEVPAAYSHFAFSADGSRVVAIGEPGALVLDEACKVLWKLDREPGTQLACGFNADATKLVVLRADKDQPIRREVIDLPAAEVKPPPVVVAESRVTIQALGNALKFVARPNADPTRWDAIDVLGGVGRTFRGHTGAITCLSATPDGKFAISGSDDRTVRVWDTATGNSVAELKGLPRAVLGVALSPDGKQALTVDGGREYTVWDVARQVQLRRVPGPNLSATCIALSEDGNRLAIGYHAAMPNSEGISAINLDGPESFWKADLPGPIATIAVAADGKTVASVSDDGKLTLVNVVALPSPTLGDVLPQVGKPREVRFSPDGKRVLVVGDKGLAVWSTVSKRVVLSLPVAKPTSALFINGGARVAQISAGAAADLDIRRVVIPADQPVVVAPPVRPRPGPTRQPVPSKEDLAAAEKDVREQFKDLIKSKSNKLSGELFRYAVGPGDQGSTNRYAALKEYRDLRAQDGDLGGAVFAASEIARRYDIDTMQAQTEAAEFAAPFGKAGVSQFHSPTLLRMISHARSEDRYDLATRLCKALTIWSSKGGPLPQRAQAAILNKEVADEQAAFKSIREPLSKLETDPEDAEANLLVGQFRFRQERWGEAARHLAKGSDAGLQSVAKKDLADPTDVAGRKAVAAAWDAEAKRARTKGQATTCCQRALFWYRQALQGAPLAELAGIQAEVRSLEKRIPDHADPWRDLDTSALSDADRKKDFLHLDRFKQISTRVFYKGGVDITVVARTPKTNIRLGAGRGGVIIFNWEGTEGGLRMHRPDSIFDDGLRQSYGSLLPGKPDVLLKVDEWHTIRWRLTPTGQKVWVDKGMVFEDATALDLSQARPVIVFTWDSPIDVKSVAVRDLGAAPRE